MTSILCINPHSRSGDAGIEPFIEQLEALGPVVVHMLDKDGPLSEVIEQHKSSLSRIVVGGGDGTLNSVLKDVVDAGVPIGILPLGTANDFARSLKLPEDPEDALDIVVNGATRCIDLGEANGHLFVNAAGIGMGPELTKSLDTERKKKFGVFAYVVSFVEVVGRKWRNKAWVKIDGQRIRLRFMQITIANGRHYGGGLTIAEDAELDDGTLRVLCLKPQSLLDLLSKVVPLRWGMSKSDGPKDGMNLYQARRVEVRTRRPVDVTVDGEFVTQTPLSCTVRPKALSVYEPDESQTPGAETLLQSLAE